MFAGSIKVALRVVSIISRLVGARVVELRVDGFCIKYVYVN